MGIFQRERFHIQKISSPNFTFGSAIFLFYSDEFSTSIFTGSFVSLSDTFEHEDEKKLNIDVYRWQIGTLKLELNKLFEYCIYHVAIENILFVISFEFPSCMWI